MAGTEELPTTGGQQRVMLSLRRSAFRSPACCRCSSPRSTSPRRSRRPQGHTLAARMRMEKAMPKLQYRANSDAASCRQMLAARGGEERRHEVVFDRGGYLYPAAFKCPPPLISRLKIAPPPGDSLRPPPPRGLKKEVVPPPWDNKFCEKFFFFVVFLLFLFSNG